MLAHKQTHSFWIVLRKNLPSFRTVKEVEMPGQFLVGILHDQLEQKIRSEMVLKSYQNETNKYT